MHIRIRYAACIALTIAAGLSVRYAPLGLPSVWVKYGGSMLWAAMVYFGVRLLFPQAAISTSVATGMTLAALAEFSRLVHIAWLDEFRLTTTGILVLGRIFAWTNLLAYAAGIMLAAAGDVAARRNFPI